MNLNFTPLKKYKSPAGLTLYYREASFTEEFRRAWRYSRESFANQGIEIIQKKDSANNKFYIVRQTLTKPFETFEAVTVKPYRLKNDLKLRKYQVPATAELAAAQIANRASFDGSDTGCGKTYMALALARELKLKPGIVCTKSGIADWKKVCAFMGVNPFFIVNWESVRSKKFPYCKKIKDNFTGKTFFKWVIPKNLPTIIFFDEVHKAAGNETQNANILISAKDYRIHLMSATVADKMVKLKNLLSVLKIVKTENFDKFLSDKGLVMDSKGKWHSLTEKNDFINVNKIIFPAFGTRLNKNKIPGFPEVQNIAKLIETPKANMLMAEFKRLQKLIFELKEKKTENSRMVLQLRFRQLAEQQKIVPLCELVKDYLEQGFAVCLFVNFTNTLNTIAKAFKTNCVVYGDQTGSKGLEQRKKNISDFQKDKQKLIILNIATGGASINLHDVNGKRPRVSIICPTWNAVELKQVLGRIHRDGAKSKAMNVLVYAERTIEEKVYEKVSAKLENIEALNDGDLADFETFKKGT